MGSFIEINDTLQISKEQGFPNELDYKQHKIKPFQTHDFEDKVLEFKKINQKSESTNYHQSVIF